MFNRSVDDCCDGEFEGEEGDEEDIKSAMNFDPTILLNQSPGLVTLWRVEGLIRKR